MSFCIGGMTRARGATDCEAGSRSRDETLALVDDV